MNIEKLRIEGIPSVIYGDDADKAFIFVHGKHSYKEDAVTLARIVTPKGYQVVSFDLPEHGERKAEEYSCTVQNARSDLGGVLRYCRSRYASLSLYGCSLGAYFSLVSYSDYRFEHCLFVSPILDMERLIERIMGWASVTERELRDKKEIETSFGEKLSWDYLSYVREHRVRVWDSPTSILFGEHDDLTEKETLQAFAEKYRCSVDVMEGGEHYFHTKDQLDYVERWIRSRDL